MSIPLCECGFMKSNSSFICSVQLSYSDYVLTFQCLYLVLLYDIKFILEQWNRHYSVLLADENKKSAQTQLPDIYERSK